jgi:large subunit ribosomal protein L21
VKVGTPVVEGAKVTAKVVEHIKAKKFGIQEKTQKKLPKKEGHRQY